jgi:hypothetical protein
MRPGTTMMIRSSYNAFVGPNSTSALRYMLGSIQGIVNAFLSIFSGTQNWYTVPIGMRLFGWYSSIPGVN